MTTAASNFMIEIYRRTTGETLETIYDPSVRDRDAAIMAGVKLCVHDYKNNPDIFYRIIER